MQRQAVLDESAFVLNKQGEERGNNPSKVRRIRP